MKTTYRASDWKQTEFDNPVDCQIYEKIWEYDNKFDEDSEWHSVIDSDLGFDQTGFNLKTLVQHRHLFKSLLDRIFHEEAAIK